MIKIKTDNAEYVVTPTIFPDGTSQVWKLPEDVFRSSHMLVTWNFESEREVIDLLSLRKLLPNPAYTLSLHVPYLPYGRQDKAVSNWATFNIRVLADLINSMDFYRVTSVDVHNPEETAVFINRFKNIKVTEAEEREGLLQTIFENGKVCNTQTLSEIRARLLSNLTKAKT